MYICKYLELPNKCRLLTYDVAIFFWEKVFVISDIPFFAVFNSFVRAFVRYQNSITLIIWSIKSRLKCNDGFINWFYSRHRYYFLSRVNIKNHNYSYHYFPHVLDIVPITFSIISKHFKITFAVSS